MEKEWDCVTSSYFRILCSELHGCTRQENMSTFVPGLDSMAALHLPQSSHLGIPTGNLFVLPTFFLIHICFGAQMWMKSSF